MDLTMYRGDSAAWDFTVTTPAGAAVDLTDAVDISFTVKARITDLDAAAVAAKTVGDGVTVTSAAGGLLRVQLDPADTSALTVPVRLLWDLQLTDDTNAVYTVAAGMLEVLADVTLA